MANIAELGAPPEKRITKEWLAVKKNKINWLFRKMFNIWPGELDKEMGMAIDQFSQHIYFDPDTGAKFKYNLFIPENYDPKKSYPMVLFMHDRGVLSKDVKTTLFQGMGAVIWATKSEQAKHECFVLAPQYWHTLVNDASEAFYEMDATVNLVKTLSHQYNIDTDRLYTTGQSMGCMASIEMLIKYPGLFAGALLVAGQWSAEKMSSLTEEHMWIIVSQGDEKAFPGMNASVAALEAKGARISKGTWDGTASPEELEPEVAKMVKEGNHILYTTLKKGTVVPEGIPDTGINNHMHTWRIAYPIEGVRDWLFAQKKNSSIR